MSQQRTTELLESGLGKPNIKRVTGTDATTPDAGFVFCAIQAETDTVISTATGNFTANAFDGATIAAEGIRYGRFTSVTLTSGSVILYQVSK